MKESREKKLLKSFNNSAETIVYGFVIIAAAIPLLLVFKFAGSSFSSSIDKWGQAGDYIGGFLNPLVSIASVFFLIYLTLIVKDRDDKSDVTQINTQKLLAINQLRYESVKEIAKILNKIQIGSLSSQPTLDVVTNIQESYEFFIDMNGYLFNELFTDEFRKTYRFTLESTLRGLTMEIVNDNATGTSGPPSERMNRLLNDYWNQKNAFVNELNKYVFQEMSPTQ